MQSSLASNTLVADMKNKNEIYNALRAKQYSDTATAAEKQAAKEAADKLAQEIVQALVWNTK